MEIFHTANDVPTNSCILLGTREEAIAYPKGDIALGFCGTCGFVGNTASSDLVRECVKAFRSGTPFPSEGAALPDWLPGVGWSDHWAFWQAGYAGVMITDTAPYRYPHYHAGSDTIDKIDLDRFARVVAGLEKVIARLASD